MTEPTFAQQAAEFLLMSSTDQQSICEAAHNKQPATGVGGRGWSCTLSAADWSGMSSQNGEERLAVTWVPNTLSSLLAPMIY